MTERNQVHAVARKYLAPFGRFERVDTPLADGWPDVYYNLRRVSGWIEEKIVEPSGRCPDHLTLEQVMWGEAEVRAGGRWYLLARCGSTWWLMTAAACRVWREGGPAEPIFAIRGRFPTREILDVIAPLAPLEGMRLVEAVYAERNKR